MISHHFAIERDDRAKPYGYAWAKDAKTLELAGLSAEQSLLLSLAHDELRFLLPANISHGLNGFFESAEHHLRNQTKPEVSAWRNKVASVPPTFPLLPPAIDDDVFASISQALFENRYLDIIYQAHRKKPKSDTVMALALVRQEPRLYLVVKYKGVIWRSIVSSPPPFPCLILSVLMTLSCKTTLPKGILASATAVRFACLFVLTNIKAFILPKRPYPLIRLSKNLTTIIISVQPCLIAKCWTGGLPNLAMMCGTSKKDDVE